ncbi:MAG: hypothetical protein DHS20C09_21170 [marine bacterium B5-7]|nr:MAG: hypothetical protein DHS20C09_21170 [marine bacterium B5-7]
MKKYNSNILKTVGFLLCFGGTVATGSVMAADEPACDTCAGGFGEDWSFAVSGYARTYFGVNLEDHAETPGNDQFDFNMARATLLLDTDIYTGPVSWKIISRFDREIGTDYLDSLEAVTKLTSNNGTATRGQYLDQYNTDHLQEFFREYYADFALFDGKLNMRVGKQQLVWGESDFFQAMDLVHGFDYRWRLFFENNEDWRKPLFLVNFDLDLYDELGGSLNFFVRPGLDRDDDVGSNFNIEGGRWIPHPYRGVDFTAFTQYNADHTDGSQDDPTFGFRWNSDIGSIGYSVAYLRTFNPAPIMNPAVNSATPGAFGVGAMNSFGEVAQNGVLGDWIYPHINVFGVSANGYAPFIDSTLSAEVAFIPNKPFNFGALGSSLPGWEGVKTKDTLVTMFRIDKEFKWGKYLGTNRPSLSSVQLFDTWILDHKDSDEIVEFASFGAVKREHTAYLTIFSLLNFKRDTINPTFVVGTDLSNGGGFGIAAVEFVFGDDWRVKVEADLWWSDGDEKKVSGVGTTGPGSKANPLGVSENSASLFDWFADDNQLVLKVTRQF